jgi:hypothetical protein
MIWFPNLTDNCKVAENGSGGFMSDLTFQGGKYGICKFYGHQKAFRMLFS